MASVAAAPEPATPAAAPAALAAVHPPAASDGGVTFFVGAIWLVMVTATLWLVCRHGFPAPLMDEYPYITPVLTGEQPVSLSWLWETYGDNRIPFAKILNIAFFRLTNYDFRAAPVFHVLWLGATALGLIWTARRLRGRTSPTDAVFPLVLLGWSHWENLVWSMQLHFVLGHVILLVVLLLIAGQRAHESPRTLALTGAGVALFPTLGPSALAYVPALVVWLGYVAYLHGKDSAGVWRRPALVAAGLAAAAVLMAGLFFLGYQKDTSAKTSADVYSWLRGVLQGISMALASDSVSQLALEEWWPPLWAFAAWSLISLYGATAARLAHVWLRQPAERARAAGLLLYLSGGASLMVIYGWARGHGDQILTQPRYSIFAMPPLFCAYYAWVLYGPRPAAELIQTGVFAAVALLLPVNLEYGHNYTVSVAATLHNFVDDLRSGLPPYVLADRHFTSIFVTGDAPLIDQYYKMFLAKQMRELREAGVPPFDALREDTDVVRLRFWRPRPVDEENIVWSDDKARGEDLNAFVTYALPHPEFVLAVRLRYRLDKGAVPAEPGLVQWKNGADTEFSERRSAPLNLVTMDPNTPVFHGGTTWIWVNDTIDHLRIYPSASPFVLAVDEIIVIVPREAPAVAGNR